MFSRTTNYVMVAAVSVITAVAIGCTPAPPPRSTTPPVTSPTTTVVTSGAAYMSVMGNSRVSAKQMAAWYKHKTAWYTGTAGATVPVQDLAQMFLDEGRDGKVRGDIAFVQAMLETGWLRFSTRMPMEFNNFSGIGAVDGGTSAAKFPNARTGVRAQIQHLRAYADPKATSTTLGHPLVDPRFNLVNPKGKAPNWSKFGNGIWATDPDYAGKIRNLYDDLLVFSL